MAIARGSQENGWWKKFRVELGPRQALYADLEPGAERIAEYHITLLPGLLQTRAYTEALAVETSCCLFPKIHGGASSGSTSCSATGPG